MKVSHVLKRASVGLGMIFIASSLLYWCLRQIDFGALWQDIYKADFLSLIAAMVCIYTILLINTWQWQLFLPKSRPLSFERMFRVIRVMGLMDNVIPWGKAFIIYHLGQIEKVGKAVAVSVLTLDQVAEGASKLIIFLIVAYVAPLPLWMTQGISIAVVTIVISYFTLLYLAYRHKEYEEADPEDLHQWHQKIFHFISKWAHHLHAMRDYKITLLTIFHAILMKACEVGAVYFVQLSFGVDLPLWSSFFLVAAYNLSTIIPVTPGNVGIFEATVFYAYKSMGVDPTQAMSLALLNHFVYLVPMVVPGYWVSVRMGINLSQTLFDRDSRLVTD